MPFFLSFPLQNAKTNTLIKMPDSQTHLIPTSTTQEHAIYAIISYLSATSFFEAALVINPAIGMINP